MENKSNIENIIITDEDLNFLISNQKISARLLSLIEIVDKMILNQFFIFYTKKIKNTEIKCYEKEANKHIEKDFLNTLKKVKKISYNYYLYTKNSEIESKELNNSINKINYKLTEKEEKIKEEYKKIANENIMFPFDVFGTVFFMRFIKTIFSQVPESDEVFLNIIRKHLSINFNNDLEFLTNIYRIFQLRQLLVHKKKVTKTQIDFYDSTKETKTSVSIFPLEFSLIDSLTSLFIFLPLNVLFETNDFIYSNMERYAICPYCKEIFTFRSIKKAEDKNKKRLFCKNCNKEILFDKLQEIEINTESKEKIIKILNSIVKKVSNQIVDWTKENNLILAKKIKDFEVIKDHTKTYCNYSLFYFIKLYNFVGEKNIIHIRTIIKTLILDDKNNSFKKDDFKKIKFEEIYKIFMLLVNINEIFRNNFIIPYELLDTHIHHLEKYKILSNKIKNTNKERDTNKKNLNNNKNISKIEEEKIITKIKDIRRIIKKLKHRQNSILIKSKNVNLVRNNIAHANLFFYDINKENKINSFNIDKLFNLYVSTILEFYNSNYNFKQYNNAIDNIEIDNNFKNLKSFKRMLIKQLTQLLNAKDYLFLLVPEETKNKKGIKSIKYEIQKLSISTDNKDTKEAFKKVVKEKIKNIISNPNKNIKGQIRVMKYKFYYFLKSVLIKELNLIKAKDLENK